MKFFLIFQTGSTCSRKHLDTKVNKIHSWIFTLMTQYAIYVFFDGLPRSRTMRQNMRVVVTHSQGL